MTMERLFRLMQILGSLGYELSLSQGENFKLKKDGKLVKQFEYWSSLIKTVQSLTDDKVIKLELSNFLIDYNSEIYILGRVTEIAYVIGNTEELDKKVNKLKEQLQEKTGEDTLEIMARIYHNIMLFWCMSSEESIGISNHGYIGEFMNSELLKDLLDTDLFIFDYDIERRYFQIHEVLGQDTQVSKLDITRNLELLQLEEYKKIVEYFDWCGFEKSKTMALELVMKLKGVK